MATNLTKISKDKLVHGVNKPTQDDHLIAIDNALRELYLIDKKSFYAANALRKNWQYVPFDICMPDSPVVTLNKTRIIQVKEWYYEDEEYEGWDPDNPTGEVINGCLLDSGRGPTSVPIGSAPDLPDSFKNTWESGGGVSWSVSEDGDAGWNNSLSFIVNWESPLAEWFYDEMGFPRGTTAGRKSTFGDVDEGTPFSSGFQCGDINVPKGPGIWTGYVRLGASWTDPPPYGATDAKNAEYALVMRFSKVTLTRPVLKWRWVDKEVPYIEYEIPPILDEETTEWSYRVADLVGENEILTEFLVMTESSGDASGMFLVGYDTDPNILISVNTRLGQRLDIPDQKYYSDSRRAYMAKIPVPEGTEVVNIRYIKNRPPEEKTYGRVLGYSKCLNVKAIIDSIIEERPEIYGLTYGMTAKQDLTTLMEASTGIFGYDSTNTDDPLKATATAAFVLPYNAERFGHIHVLGSMYAGRNNNPIKWVDFDKPLRKENYGNFHIEKFDYRNNDGDLFYIWNLIVSKYNGGPGEVYAGIRNVRIVYR